MKLAFRVTIICVYPLSHITNTFEDFTFLTVFSYPEKPAPENWNIPSPWLSTGPPHLGLQILTMIVSGVGSTPTIVKARSFPPRPPHPVPPLLRSSRVCPSHHPVPPVNICTHCLPWRLWLHEIRPARLKRRHGMLMTQLEQKVPTIPAPPRTARLSRASESHYKPHKYHRILSICCVLGFLTDAP